MIKIPEEIIDFFESEKIVIVATTDNKCKVNLSVKGLASIDPDGKIYIIDLYHGKTWENLGLNSSITIAAVNEEKFKGWQLKGLAKEYDSQKSEEIMKNWDKKILKRISDRIIRNLKKKKQLAHSEVHLPEVEYIIEMQVEEIIDLSGRKTS